MEMTDYARADRTQSLDALDELMQVMGNLGNDRLSKVFHDLYLEVETLDFSKLVECEMDPTASNRNDYMCAFCNLPMGQAYCYGCGDYKGAMTKTVYLQYVGMTA